jgi:intraflagellar transport protein 140
VLIYFVRGKNQAAKDIAGRYPMSHYWDAEESKLLVCEAHILAKELGKDAKEPKKKHSLTKAVEEGPVSLFSILLR